jgi:hypothetical protein
MSHPTEEGTFAETGVIFQLLERSSGVMSTASFLQLKKIINISMGNNLFILT